MKKEYFYLVADDSYANKFRICMNHEYFLFPTGTDGSYNVFISRVLNLSFAQTLRYMRDRLGAELVGKNCRYVMAYFENTKEVKAFVKMLNASMEYIMNVHNNPYVYITKEDGTIEKVPMNFNEN